MANFFKINHLNGTSTTINLDSLEYVNINKKKLNFYLPTRVISFDFEKEEGAKKIYDEIYKYNDHEDDIDEDDESESYHKYDNEKILTKRIDKLLDLLNEKNREIEKLKGEKKGFIDKIKGML